MIMSSTTTLCAPDNRIHMPIYSTDSAILCIRLLIFSRGILDKRAIFICLSSWYWLDSVSSKTHKQFLNHAFGEDGHVNRSSTLQIPSLWLPWQSSIG